MSVGAAIERSVVLDQLSAVEADQGSQAASPIDPSVPYDEARQRALAEFERGYLELQLRAHADNVSAAARASGVGRVHFHRLLRRSGLR